MKADGTVYKDKKRLIHPAVYNEKNVKMVSLALSVKEWEEFEEERDEPKELIRNEIQQKLQCMNKMHFDISDVNVFESIICSSDEEDDDVDKYFPFVHIKIENDETIEPAYEPTIEPAAEPVAETAERAISSSNEKEDYNDEMLITHENVRTQIPIQYSFQLKVIKIN